MAVFEYKGILVATGKATSGHRDAENVKALRVQLRKDGVLLTTATEEKKGSSDTKANAFSLKRFLERPSVADVALMTRQLATLVRAQIPLFESLSALIEQTEKDALRRALTNVRDTVREGTSFADALKEHPSIFPDLYVNMVRAGESSGTLDAVLLRLTNFMEGQAKLRGKVSSALAYPILMMVIALVMISVLMTSVVPKVTSIFESMQKALPWYTRSLIVISDFTSNFWWLILLALVGGTTWFRRWKRTADGRLSWDRIVLRAPLFGQLVMMVSISRFARTLATLLSAGVALLPAMGIVRNVLGNAALERVVEDATGSIREGQSIAEPLKASGYFPPLVTHMIAIGERSGQLEQMLENVAEAYDTAVDARVQLLTSLLEPIIIVVMGGAVAFIAFAILMPLIQMSSFVE
ncbi:MAG: type II secretion system inner membrane protein GspF [Deltaproteobacteria bacterium]|nr:type II secretion system inner membrane protein GspF [Deltaproteobacteria bacterium]